MSKTVKLGQCEFLLETPDGKQFAEALKGLRKNLQEINRKVDEAVHQHIKDTGHDKFDERRRALYRETLLLAYMTDHQRETDRVIPDCPAIVDCEGVVDLEGKPVPFSIENRQWFCKMFPYLVDHLLDDVVGAND